MHAAHRIAVAFVSLSLARAAAAGAADVPDAAFHLTFDDTASPAVATAGGHHPAEALETLTYVAGRQGKAVLIGAGPILVYRAHGNVPDEATITFWIKPIDWAETTAWRDLLFLKGPGRRGMMFSNYPRHHPDVQFTWSPRVGREHERTRRELAMNQWNHVAIAWDGFRSRVYFDGALVLTKDHPAGWRPLIADGTTLNLGGICPGGSTSRAPWGTADTAVDELKVFPGMLSAVQIATLAGRPMAARALTGIPPQPPALAIPRLARAPKLDGHLAEHEWDGASSLATLIDSTSPGRSFDYPEQQVYFAYDDASLYVAMRSHFPTGASYPEAPVRRGLDDADVEVWGSESFELWLIRPGDERPYRFAGSPGGGFTEQHARDNTWNGAWTYRWTIGRTVHATDYWDVELAVPFSTLGIEAPDGAELKMNFARTWRSLEQLGPATSWIGSPSYLDAQRFAAVRLDPAAPALRVQVTGSPATGQFEQSFTIHHRDQHPGPYRGTLTIGLQAELAENDTTVAERAIEVPPGKSQLVRVPVTIADPMFQRVGYALTPADGDRPTARHSVPFALRTDFLDLVPLNLQHALVIKPAHTLLTARLAAEGAADAAVFVQVFDAAGRKIHQRQVDSDRDVRLDLPPDGPWGDYAVRMHARAADGTLLCPNERRFHRPVTPPWMKTRDDSKDRVLPPFTPLVTEGDRDTVDVRCWGRVYRYRSAPVPAAIGTGGLDDILAGPMALVADGATLPAAALEVTLRSDIRADLSASVETDALRLTNTCWIEYDGLIYNTVDVTAKTNVDTIDLRVPCKAAHARYAHLTGGLMSLGGGYTREVDETFTSGFWPVVWLGDFERGLCWFAETRGHLAARVSEPIAVHRTDEVVTLRIRLVDKLEAGKSVTLKFGFMATPVRPLHPRYPLNVFARAYPHWKQPPPRQIHADVWWSFHQWFLDIPEHQGPGRAFTIPHERWRRRLKAVAPLKALPYFDPYTLTSEYPEANWYLREWEMLPAVHRTGGTRKLPDGTERQFMEYWMSPQAESFRRYFTHRIAGLIERTGIHGLYFDFGVALRDSNGYHGGHGGYCILAVRDLYRRLVNEFVKAGVTDYVIVVHNSRSVQIPSLAFATHLYNGEHHRQKSGSTLHDGRDYLDTLPLYYFGIEQSGLPWGLHGNMLAEFPENAHLLGQEIGVNDETVAEYLRDRTPSLVMPILLHNCLPDGFRLSTHYYKRVFGVLEDFDVPSATFHPYWRNQEEITVDNPAFKVSFYTRPEAPRALLVIGNLDREAGEVTVELDMARLYDWGKATGGMARVKKRSAILEAVEHIGARDARILELGPRHITLWVKGHGMALVQVAGHGRQR